MPLASAWAAKTRAGKCPMLRPGRTPLQNISRRCNGECALPTRRPRTPRCRAAFWRSTQFFLEELRAAIKKMKNEKAAGPGDFPAEFWE
eukprot:3850097-Pyramimonas_sp.AAC.1